MQKIFLCLSLVLFSVDGFCQNNSRFLLQSDGQFATSDGEKYVVIEKNGMDKSQIFEQTMIAVSKLFDSNEEAIETIEGTSITIHGTSDRAYVMRSAMGFQVLGYVNYILCFQFKEGKLRIDAPTIKSLNIMGDIRNNVEKELSFFGFFKKGK